MEERGGKSRRNENGHPPKTIMEIRASEANANPYKKEEKASPVKGGWLHPLRQKACMKRDREKKKEEG